MRQEDREISNEVTDLKTDTRASKSGRLEAGRLTDTSQATAEGTQVVFDTGQHGQSSHALRDIVSGLGNVGLWSMIGWRDIKQRYRRSVVGPFWVTLSMAFMVLGLGVVYGGLFRMDLQTYLPFICLGLITWEFISKSILDGSMTFLLLEGLIKQIRLPLTTHIASSIWKNVVVLGHNMVIYVILALVFGINPGWAVLYVVPGFFLVLLNLSWIALILALVCTRYRDVPQIVQTTVQMLFFVTPVFWSPDLMPQRTVLVHGNPFYHMIEVVRAPLLGTVPDADSWVFLLVTLGLGWLGTFYLFTKFRRRIAYWL
jgi:ABC-type polysaccharide/polyol phosphate export permease